MGLNTDYLPSSVTNYPNQVTYQDYTYSIFVSEKYKALYSKKQLSGVVNAVDTEYMYVI